MQEENLQIHSFVYSVEVVALVKAANETATFFEELKGGEGKAFISEVVGHLSTLYSAMLKMGKTEPVNNTEGESTVSEQDWSQLFQRISQLLGPHNEIIRPAEENEFDRFELVTHTISEDLADLYQELRDFTTIYSRGVEELMNDAVWELRERFAEHWGKKLLRSLSALHDLFVEGTDPTAQ